MQIHHYKSNEFETLLALDLPNDKTIEDKLIHLKSGSGFPVYNSYYVDLEKYILGKVTYFNNDLRKFFVVNGSKCGAVLTKTDPTMKHYAERFPENQFTVTPGQLFLKPACCATAFKIWQSKKTSLRKKEIIHEVSDCYRVENTGTTRTLRRNCCFTMPDYHMITIKEDVLEDFLKVRSCLFKFNESVFGPSWSSNFYQVIRVNNISSIKYKDFISELARTSVIETIVEEVDWTTSTPYFELKFELSYKNGPKLITLGTLQIDYLYPQLFGLDTTMFGARPSLHFSQGSICRIMDVMIRESVLPKKGVKLLCLEGDPLEQWNKLDLKCAILVEDTATSIKKAIPSTFYELLFYPLLVVIGSNQIKSNTVTVFDRVSKRNYTCSIDEFKEEINRDIHIMESKQIHYKSTFCN